MTEHRRRYFFVHVMKTAGSSFRSQLEDNFPGAFYPDARSLPQGAERRHANLMIQPLLDLTPEQHEHITAYAGHFPYVAASLVDPEMITLTMLRHPVDRTISYLKHCKRYNPQHHDLELDQIYDDPFTFPTLIHNHQVKVFAMTADDKLESIMDVIEIDAQRLEIAKRNISQVDVLGFSDAYDEFVATMEQTYGWTFVPRGKWWESTEDWAVSDALRRRIEQDNAADIEFYEFARRRAAERTG